MSGTEWPASAIWLIKQLYNYMSLVGFLGFRLQSTKCMTLVEMWKKLQHTNVVQLREVFTTKAFGDNCK